MKYCCYCGELVALKIPEGDNLPRHVCETCGEIHYQNPKIVAGCIPEWEDKILLCKRAIEPRYGFWTLPAGFMENDETTMEAAARETLEEARAAVDIRELYCLFNLPHINQIYVMFRGCLLNTDFGPGSESLEVGLYQEQDIPWGEMAFPVVHESLKLYFQDRAAGQFRFRVGDITKTAASPPQYEVKILQS
ncbi:MAG: NUDIX hydrolase [Gammaproteobacteria bacterium]|nr:MAG: NUDIX hydrolase [Gammaproteobacteria bacterium]